MDTKTIFPKDIMDSMRTCILSIFWPKKDILSFFSNNGCTKKDLEIAINFEESNLSRAHIVDTIFNNLITRHDGGLGQFRSILYALVNWEHFDPYYFKKLKKLDENEAVRNLNHLRQLQEIRDAKLKKQKEERHRKEREHALRKSTSERLKRILSNLYQGKDELGEIISQQKRGYLLESFLKELLLYESLNISGSIKLKGEQIDGAIKYEGENYIFEAKWQDALIASDALYQFAHKVEGKLYGRGLFISINGFSTDSVNALMAGKALKTILIDGADLTYVVEGLYSFKEILDIKIRAAQTMGQIYTHVNSDF